METKFRIRPSELNNEFIQAIKDCYGDERELEIIINPVESPKNTDEQARQEHLARLKQAAELANKDNSVPLTPQQFLSLRNKLEGL